MKYTVCAVFDKAADAFGRPIFVAAPGAAIRSFQDEVNRKADDNTMYHHAKDYDLYRLGHFDDSTGLFDCAKPEKIASGAQLQLQLDQANTSSFNVLPGQPGQRLQPN